MSSKAMHLNKNTPRPARPSTQGAELHALYRITRLIGNAAQLELSLSQILEILNDTLQMERQRFPSVLELVTGKFLRHSDAFYRWRIQDRQQKLKSDAQRLDWLDDLAVAYDKTGQQDLAIETIQRKQAIKPDLYETHANWGTFLVHAGRFEEGLVHLKQAVEINPDAHFGRERYQILLIEYLLDCQQDGTNVLPLDATLDGRPYEAGGYAAFVLQKLAAKNGGEKNEFANNQPDEEISQALRGVLGMMRFGNYQSPVLLEAAGDLLLASANQDAKRLAARCYLKASYEVQDETVRTNYRKLAERALSMQTIQPRQSRELPLDTLEKRFRQELQEASRWHAAVVADEERWIAAGLDVDQEFTNKYYQDPEIGKPADQQPATDKPRSQLVLMIVGALALAVMAGVGFRWVAG